MKHLTLFMTVVILALAVATATAQTRDGRVTIATTFDRVGLGHASPAGWYVTFVGFNRVYDLMPIAGEPFAQPVGPRPCPVRRNGTRVLARSNCTVFITGKSNVSGGAVIPFEAFVVQLVGR